MIYPGINNLELNRKITKFIFRLHYSTFHIHKSPKITLIAIFLSSPQISPEELNNQKLKTSANSAYVCALLNSCICHVHAALENATEVILANRRHFYPRNSR